MAFLAQGDSDSKSPTAEAGEGPSRQSEQPWECQSEAEEDRQPHSRGDSARRPGDKATAQPPSPVMTTSSPSSRNFLVCPFPSSMAFVPLHDSSNRDPKLSGSFVTRKGRECHTDLPAAGQGPGAPGRAGGADAPQKPSPQTTGWGVPDHCLVWRPCGSSMPGPSLSEQRWCLGPRGG